MYHDAGYPDEAVRYGELAARYEQNAQAAPSVADRQEARAAAMAASATSDRETAADRHPEFAVQEMAVQAPSDAQDLSSELSSDLSSDLSSEWEDSLSVEESAPAAEPPAAVEGDADASSNPEIAETVEEIRFYLEHFMTDQARAGFEKLETLTSDAGILDPLRAAIESAGPPPAEPEPEITEIDADEIGADEPADFEVEMESQHGSEAATSPDLLAGYHPETHREMHNEAPAEIAPAPMYAEPAYAEASELTALVADLEASLGDSFPQAQPPAAPLPAAQVPATQAADGAQPWPDSPVSPAPAAAKMPQPEPEPVPNIPVPNIEVEIPAAAAMPAIAASAGGAAAAAAPAMTMSYGPVPVRPLGAAAMHASGSVDLSQMFGELKQELEEEVIAGDDDPETHYNLGVAFREMGLLDEAIAELQKVCTAINRGKAFAQPVQTYTWLAQCFLDKGVPEAAIRWYEKALSIPGLDDEARLAINYELGAACETAMDKPAALRHFTDVYGSNIDYRDVAERIQALKS